MTAFSVGGATGLRARIAATLSADEWRRATLMGGFVIALHVVGVLLLVGAVGAHVVLADGTTFGLGTGVLAYTLGMRHAFDADHIAAIDNTTRKLMADGQRPLGVGFFFSLGHSSVVFAMSVLLGLGVRAVGPQIAAGDSPLHRLTGVIGASVSGTFLYLIALLNLVVLVAIVRAFLAMRRGEYDDAEMERHLDSRGLMNRFFGKLTRRIDASWKMYPLGFLFGLGFDTATEIALLVLAGGSVSAGMPIWGLLSLPILFAAGMSLLDTIDGSFMNFAYGWAFSNPVRKVYYNITITGLSVVTALFIGTIELLQVLGDQLGLHGGAFGAVAGFDLNSAGFVIVAMFAATWFVALTVWHFASIEERWGQPATAAHAAPLAARFDPPPAERGVVGPAPVQVHIADPPPSEPASGSRSARTSASHRLDGRAAPFDPFDG